jgi:hypothetical protein
MSQEARKGRNEAWFREVNERLEQRVLDRTKSSTRFEIVCECAREECTERIAISIADYEAVRRSPTSFVVLTGHMDPTCERLVSSTHAFEVVEKFGDAGLVAEIENPRDGEGQPREPQFE